MNSSRKAVIISASSDIGVALCKSWRSLGWSVLGTFRTRSPAVEELERVHKIPLFHCDLLDPHSLQAALSALEQETWDILVFAPGWMEPIGHFDEVDFSDWEKGVSVNFLKPLQILHRLLPKRGQHRPTVLFFAGGGINSAVARYSSYTISKIALTKMCELLDAEIPDTRFVIVGPGWVNTKIHEATLRAKEAAGPNFQRTVERIQKEEWIPMEKVVACCTYLVTSPCEAISGRNFSTAFDQWGTRDLEEALVQNQEMYKLRRQGNEWGKQ